MDQPTEENIEKEDNYNFTRKTISIPKYQAFYISKESVSPSKELQKAIDRHIITSGYSIEEIELLTQAIERGLIQDSKTKTLKDLIIEFKKLS